MQIFKELWDNVNDKSKLWLSSSSDEKTLSKLLVVAAILLAVTVIIALLFMALTGLFNAVSGGEAVNAFNYMGPFGDFIGGVLNPVLTFLMFMGVLVTIVIQSKELEQTRLELTRSADAQEKTQEIQKIQTNNLEKQQFESTFFSLLEQHNSLLKDLNETNERRTDKKPAIDVVRLSVFESDAYSLSEGKYKIEQLNSSCGHYFRVLYQILKFISTESPKSCVRRSKEHYCSDLVSVEVTETEKFYSNIVRSFLSYSLTQLLAVNCYCESEEDTYYKYKLLVERYSLLEHMPINDKNEMLHETLDFYSERAFGNSQFVDDFKKIA